MGVYGTTANKLQGSGGTPIPSLGAGISGNGASISAEGTNTSCVVTITTGSLGISTGGDLFTLTLADGAYFPNKVRPQITSSNLAFANIFPNTYVSNTTANSFTLRSSGISVAASTTLMVTILIAGD